MIIILLSLCASLLGLIATRSIANLFRLCDYDRAAFCIFGSAIPALYCLDFWGNYERLFTNWLAVAIAISIIPALLCVMGLLEIVFFLVCKAVDRICGRGC